MRVSLITCARLPEPDPDEQLLLDALRDAGIAAKMLAWDAADPEGDVCILRSAWNYYERPDEFLAWIERAPRLVNPSDIVRWNHHKSYLGALQRMRIPIIPTEWIPRGPAPALADVRARHGWDDVVVKPAVGASSFATRRFGAGDGQDFLVESCTARDTMVQQYVPGAERALVWIDGEFTHAVEKTPRWDGEDEVVSDALALTDDESAFGEQVLDKIQEDLLYARVDVLRGADGGLLLSELELIEPSLFLLQSPAALTRFVAAIERLFAA